MIGVADPPRYANLADTVRRHECRRIIEIGVWNGYHGKQMIEAAKLIYPAGDVYYLGFDLFEDLDQETFDREFSKTPPPLQNVLKYLNQTGAMVELVKGDTKDTLFRILPYFENPDFIFIDGGHSEETIASDWRNVEAILQPDTIVIFDDYYIDTDGNMPGLGCNSLIDGLDREMHRVEFLQPVDSFVKAWGVLNVQMVKVMLNA